jgi:hypothetical protein|tara:strand:- start:25194 stop:26834 length:1641 start_codon:yes stop_codon:yes gene_type:complete
MKFKDLLDIVFPADGKNTSLSNYWKTQINKDPILSDLFVCIDLVFGNGKKLSIATDFIQTTDDDGKIYSYQPLLQSEPQIDSSITLSSGAASVRSFPLTVDGRFVDAMSMVLSGSHISGFAEVSLQIRDGSYSDRIIVLRGDISGNCVFGALDELVELEIADPKKTFPIIIPDVILNSEEISTLPDDQKGQRIPIVINKSSTGIPCIRKSAFQYGPEFVVCYGTEFQIDSVNVDGVDKASNDPFYAWSSSIKYTEKTNTPYLNIDFQLTTNNAGIPNVWEDESVYARVSRIDNQQSDILNTIVNLIANYSKYNYNLIDKDLLSRSYSKLGNIFGQVIINDSSSQAVDTFQYIESTICESFPMISMAFSGIGYAPVVIDRRSEVFSGNFVVGQEYIVDRISSISELGKEDIYNSFTIKYDYDAVNDNYRKVKTRDSSNSEFCAISRDRIGLRENEILESVVHYDDNSVEYVLDWMAAHLSLPSYEVQYQCFPSIFIFVKIGDNIKITDHELGFTERIATVTGISYKKGEVILTLRFWFLYENIARAF